MEIVIKKGKNRNTLRCIRKDGTSTSIDLGPNIPNHDIAHYVVEKQFNLKKGFYGNIISGMTITQLSDKNIIKTLGNQTWVSEIMARNLQSISSGAAYIDEFITLVTLEAKTIEGIVLPIMDLKDIKAMKLEFDTLCKQWELLLENEELKLKFE